MRTSLDGLASPYSSYPPLLYRAVGRFVQRSGDVPDVSLFLNVDVRRRLLLTEYVRVDDAQIEPARKRLTRIVAGQFDLATSWNDLR